MTFLPPSRVKSPVWESIFSIWVPSMALSKPSARSLAGADPVVPSRTTILVGVSPKLSAAHWPAVSPSFLKSSPTQLAYRSSDEVTVRSSRTTGMSASSASCRTSSQPSSTIGAITIASTPWLMKLRTAAIWAAGSLSAALKTRSKPFSFENAFFMDSVLALRQPDSEPVCAKPTLIVSPPLPELAARIGVATTAGREECQGTQHRDTGHGTSSSLQTSSLAPA